MNVAAFIVAAMNIPQIIECSSPFAYNVRHSFLSFSHKIIHPDLRMILRMSKKMDYFLRNFVRREKVITWFNINPLSFISWNSAR